MQFVSKIAVITASYVFGSAAFASVLVSNIDEPVRGTTAVAGDLWAAQAFQNDGTASQLTSIRTILGEATGAPDAFAELRLGSTTGAIVATFALPGLTGASSARTLTPLGAVMLAPNATYLLIMGVHGGGSFGWSYAEGNAFTGTGFFHQYEYSFDQAGTWTNYGGDNPYLMEVNVAAAVVPEPASWALLIAGFGAIGAGKRRTRQKPAPVAV